MRLRKYTPSTFVEVPIVVPATLMETPTTGSDLSLVTFPVRRIVWANRVKQKRVKMVVRLTRTDMLCNLPAKHVFYCYLTVSPALTKDEANVTGMLPTGKQKDPGLYKALFSHRKPADDGRYHAKEQAIR